MQSISINDRVEKIKNDIEEINSFVEEYNPFIAACAQKSAGRYVRYGQDDELSIAMMAFVEAVKSFEKGKGNFLSFAQSVIKRRLIDYYRKEGRHSNVVSIMDYLPEDGSEMDSTIYESVERYSEGQINEYRRLELEEFKKQLSKWDISLQDLVDVSPKHKKSQNMCREIIRFLQAHSDLTDIIMNKMYLPIADIERSLKIPRKKIERVRKYIIAVVIIFSGDYQYIRDYIDFEGGESNESSDC